MGVKLYFMGDACYFNFPRNLLSKVMCTLSVYDHTFDTHGPISKGANYHAIVTVPSEDSFYLIRSVKKDFNSKYLTGLKQNFKASKLGRKYELRLPEKIFKSFRALMKARGCKAEKVSRNEGDGNVSVFVIIPWGEVVKIKTVIDRYAKKNGF